MEDIQIDENDNFLHMQYFSMQFLRFVHTNFFFGTMRLLRGLQGLMFENTGMRCCIRSPPAEPKKFSFSSMLGQLLTSN